MCNPWVSLLGVSSFILILESLRNDSDEGCVGGYDSGEEKVLISINMIKLIALLELRWDHYNKIYF